MNRIVLCMLCALLCITFAYDAHAEADIGFKGVGGRLSLVFPEEVGNAFGFGGVVDLGTFAPNVGFGATLDLWFGSESSVDYSDIVIAANSTYQFQVKNPKVKPYAGGGLALHIFSWDAPAVPPFPAVSDSDWKIGIDLIGGVRFATSEKLDIVGEAMFRIVSDVSQFVLSGGVIYKFDTHSPAATSAPKTGP